jgi:hypothetical protein
VSLRQVYIVPAVQGFFRSIALRHSLQVSLWLLCPASDAMLHRAACRVGYHARGGSRLATASHAGVEARSLERARAVGLCDHVGTMLHA